MSLKDRLSEALAATPSENTRRSDTLRAALNAGDSDDDIGGALARLIEAREQRATSLEHTGHTDQAAEERQEIASLRELLPDAAAPVAPGRSAGKRSGPLLTRTQMIMGGVALAAVAVALFVVLRPTDEADLSAAPANDKISIYKDDHTMGNPNAPITLIEYAAPVCPHCAHFAKEELPVLKREFIDTGRLFYIFRVFPLQPADGAIEGIARCLPKERYFPYIEMMFREQPQWDPDGYQIPDVEGAIVKLAAREGVSPEKAKQCMADPANQERINQIAQDAQIRYQLEGTPTFVMNGQVVNMPPGQNAIDVLRLRINSLSAGSGH